jgi:hypothetical protein
MGHLGTVYATGLDSTTDEEARMPQVAYDMDNMHKCICDDCPLFEESKCIRERSAAVKTPPTGMPDARTVEGVYCSGAIGASKCSDLNSALACICPDCQVWEENGLVENYFCLNGPARP